MLKELLRETLDGSQYAPGTSRSLNLRRPFDRLSGHAWIVRVSSKEEGNSEARPFHLSLVLLEDVVPLLGAHAGHQAIRDWGGGIYCHWEDSLIFSTADNSDPNSNGRRYEIESSLTVEQWNLARLRSQTPLSEIVCKDDKRLGPSHTAHDEIRKLGRRGFSHWLQWIYFSTSDNTDPRTNGRTYHFVQPQR